MSLLATGCQPEFAAISQYNLVHLDAPSCLDDAFESWDNSHVNRVHQEGNMRDIYAVLREKEYAIAKVRREVQALRSATPLLDEDIGRGMNIPLPPVARHEVSTQTATQQEEVLGTAGPLFADETDVLAEIRDRLVEAAENNSKLRRSNKISRTLRHIAAPLLGGSLR